MKWEELKKEEQEYFIGLLRKGNIFPDGGHVEKNDATQVARQEIVPSKVLYPSQERSFRQKVARGSNEVLGRTNQVYTNYSQAKDNPMSPAQERLKNMRRALKDYYFNGDFPAGVSNCTLTATQWIDPSNPVQRAASIVGSPEQYGYSPITAEEAVPGDLLIAKVPNQESYHTMLIDDFADNDGIFHSKGTAYNYRKGEPLLTYSRGGHDNSFIRREVPLSVYTKESDGHTENHFYRYNRPQEVVLPEIVITPNKKGFGGYFKNDLTI